jgi:hypothetical protein
LKAGDAGLEVMAGDGDALKTDAELKVRLQGKKVKEW